MRKRFIGILVSLFLINSVILTGCSMTSTAHAAGNDKSFEAFNASEGVISQGVIEVKDVSINSKIPGRILKINVEEGQEVKAGDIIVEISSDEIKAKREQAVAQFEAYKAGLEASKSEAAAAEAGYQAAKSQAAAQNSVKQKAENGARTQEIAQAQAAYDLWVKTYERVKNLFEKGAVSAQKLDEAKTQMDVAGLQLSMAKEGARSEDKSGAVDAAAAAAEMEQVQFQRYLQAQSGVKASEQKVEAAQGAIDEVDAYLKDTKITAPIDGIVTTLNSNEGELVSSGMVIAAISNLSSPWLEVNIKETDLEKITMGQKVDVKVPSYSKDSFTGKVVRINQKPDFATKRSTNDNGEFDVLSFGVKIELVSQNKVLRPGMTAFVQFKK